MKIKITTDDISYAEKVLLKPGKTFDDERKEFITNLDTLDLQAVPGSGKTTALLAKLLILERYLPLENGAGILVLSHTNAAVDEIKEKIGKHCPQLFSYPHFIGTIQQFVNRFLAIPYYAVCQGSRDLRIDAEYYQSSLEKIITSTWNLSGATSHAFKKVKHIWNANAAVIRNARYCLDEGKVILVSGMNGDEIVLNKPGKSRIKNYQDYTPDEKAEVCKCIENIKHVVFQNGALHFDDAYFLAERFIQKAPAIIELLQKRFSVVFVDEMQDMAPHQHNLLERIFYRTDGSHPVFQRIGDKNQAIYYSNILTNEVWSDRGQVLRLSGSYRLSKPVAEVVKNFAETYQDIDARGPVEHLPVILAYDDDSIGRVVPRFVSRVKELELDHIPDSTFHVIGWVKDPEKRLSVGSYWEGFDPQSQVHSKECYSSLSDYVEAAKSASHTKASKPLERLFVAATLEVLRLEGIRHPITQRAFTRTTLFAHLREEHPASYADIRLNLYRWSRAVISEAEVLRDTKDFIKIFLSSIFDSGISDAAGFINSEPSINQLPESSAEINSSEIDGVKISVGTVHSVKGKTHTATLYLETFNGSDGARGDMGYDGGKLSDQFTGIQFDGHDKTYKIKNTRVAYVGMSRPTHLLCVAIHKDRLPDVDSEKWDVVDVETEC